MPKQPLIKQIRENPSFNALSSACGDDDSFLEAICALLPEDAQLTSFLYGGDEERQRDFINDAKEDEEDISFFKPMDFINDYDLGFSIKYQNTDYQMGALDKRLENLKYSYGRYILDEEPDDPSDYSLHIRCKQEDMVIYIWFWCDDSTR